MNDSPTFPHPEPEYATHLRRAIVVIAECGRVEEAIELLDGLIEHLPIDPATQAVLIELRVRFCESSGDAGGLAYWLLRAYELASRFEHTPASELANLIFRYLACGGPDPTGQWREVLEDLLDVALDSEDVIGGFAHE
jgi:hypothetical protein